MQFEVLLEAREANESFEPGRAHLEGVLEAKMIGDKGFDLFGIAGREAQAAADVGGHAGTDLGVAVETDAVSGAFGGNERGGLADIMKQDSPGEGRGRSGGKVFEHHARVNQVIAPG